MKKTITTLIIVFCCLSLFAGTWAKDSEYDDFGDPTGKFTVSLKGMTGKYTSSETGVSNGNLSWAMFIDSSGKVMFLLQENGKTANLSTAKYTSDEYSLNIKFDDGTTKKYTGQITRNGSYYNVITIKSSLLDVLLHNSSLKLVISNDRGTYSLGSVSLDEFPGLYYDKEPLLQAERLLKSGKYDEASKMLDQMKSTSKQAYTFYSAEIVDSYVKGVISLNNGDYKKAWNYLSASMSYEDARQLRTQIPISKISFSVGDYGPAGGIIVYDIDADNDDDGWSNDGLESSKCHWRFIEVAPNSIGTYQFGVHKDLNGNSIAIFGPSDTTSRNYGRGIVNTKTIVGLLGKGDYAAKACYDYELNGFDDWYLPSAWEASSAKKYVVDGLLSSSEDYSNGSSSVYFYSSWDSYGVSKTSSYSVWPIRYVSEKCPMGHSFIEKVISSTECCKIIEKTCTVCGYSDIEEIQIQMHEYTDHKCIHCGAHYYQVGEVGPAGGIVFYDKGNYIDGWRFLEVAKEDAGKASFAGQLKSGYTAHKTKEDIGSGKFNTDFLINAFNSQAAELCKSYRGGGFSDWFLPSENEGYAFMSVLRSLKLKDYDFVSPYEKNNWGDLTFIKHWSSTEYSDYTGCGQILGSTWTSGSEVFNVRPIRAF